MVNWSVIIVYNIYTHVTQTTYKQIVCKQYGKTYFKCYAEGLEEGRSEIAIVTVYDVMTCGDDVEGYVFEVMKLDSYQGRVVYVTRYGEKYHYSSGCAGDSCYTTTYYDAVGLAYEPCHKCADEDL